MSTANDSTSTPAPDNIELFPGLPESLSPRLKWLKDHGIQIAIMDGDNPGDPDLYCCGYVEDYHSADHGGVANIQAMALGATIEEAEINFAEKVDIKHWKLLVMVELEIDCRMHPSVHVPNPLSEGEGYVTPDGVWWMYSFQHGWCTPTSVGIGSGNFSPNQTTYGTWAPWSTVTTNTYACITMPIDTMKFYTSTPANENDFCTGAPDPDGKPVWCSP